MCGENPRLPAMARHGASGWTCRNAGGRSGEEGMVCKKGQRSWAHVFCDRARAQPCGTGAVAVPCGLPNFPALGAIGPENAALCPAICVGAAPGILVCRELHLLLTTVV